VDIERAFYIHTSLIQEHPLLRSYLLLKDAH
jgi:hypothetical protein